MSIAGNADHVESGHASNPNKTQNTHAAASGSNGTTENVDSAGAADPVNIGRKPKNNGGDIVAELRELLGQDVVLLPIPTGKKGPQLSGWQNTTLDRMNDPAYVAQLRAGNIGVLLGAASGGLCAIDIDDDDEVQPFLALNPRLTSTLRTTGARGAQVWVRLIGEYPKLTKLKTTDGGGWGEWRCDGGQSVIHGVHPDGMNYQRVVPVRPVEIAFGDIHWPEHLKLPWVKDDFDLIVKEHGRPYAVSEKGGLQINDYFFVARYQREHLLVYESLEEDFYQYNSKNGLWEVVSEDQVQWQFGLDFKAAADEVGVEGFIWKRKNGMLASLVNMLRGLVGKRDAFKKREPVIHLANGMLDLKHEAPRLMSFHPDYRSRNLCPLHLDPAAQCPRFINELLRTALDEDDIDLLQRWAGCVLLGSNSAQRILLLIGTPSGGKSTLIEIIEKVIGVQNVAQIRTKHLNKQFELYKFLGKTLLTGKDVGGEFLSEEGAEVLKALVGNDLLDAEKKYGNEQFQLRGNFNMAITCNSKLRVKLEGDAGAWQRRLMIINYSKPKPKERITEFADKLIAAEGPGILNWMIEGAIKYLVEEQAYGDFQLTGEQRQRVEVLLAESDSVRQFVQDRVHFVKGQTATVTELQAAYFEYCEEMGWHAFRPQDFRSSITDLMLEIHHVGKSNDIPRGMKETNRGFRNVAVVSGQEGGL